MMDTEFDAELFDRVMLRFIRENPAPHRSVTDLVDMIITERRDVWRLQYHGDGTVNMMFIGLASEREISISTLPADELPDWAQDRIAALNIFGDNYPTEYVAGVGRRINEWVYYVEE